jgi:predicted ATPase
MAVGHGGQVFLSAAAASLVADQLPELRAAVRLCRLRSDRDGGESAAQLRAVYKTFTEGFTTADLTEARALLETDP